MKIGKIELDFFDLVRLLTWVLSLIGLVLTLPLCSEISTDPYEQGTFCLLVLTRYSLMPIMMEWLNIQRKMHRMEERIEELERAQSQE